MLPSGDRLALLRSSLMSAGAQSYVDVEALDEATRTIGWSMTFRQLDTGAGAADSLIVQRGSLILNAEYFSPGVHISAHAPARAVAFVVPVTTGGRDLAHGDVLGENDFLFFSPGSEMEIVTKGSAGDLSITLSADEFESLREGLYPELDSYPLTHSMVLEGTRSMHQRIEEGILSASTGQVADPESLSLLLARVLSTIADPRTRRSADPRERLRVVSRAVEMIEERYQDSIRLEDLCRHAHAGARTLQRAFVERFGVTPMGYLKTRRLGAARSLLAKRRPEELSVSEAARLCGFTHLGCFSVEYRRFFGESPRQTLRRSPSFR